MKNCKFCNAELEENSTVCPSCGKENEEEVETVREEIPAETAVQEAPEQSVTEEAAPAEEAAVLEAAAEEKKPEAAPVSPTKMALVISAVILVIAIIVALLNGGIAKAPVETVPEVPETTAPAPTIPADGNPDDVTCKGTYTVTDEEVIANADTVVATIGDYKLTNGQLQALYWMQVQNFLSSEYGSYMMSYGLLDYTQPLDVQVCAMTGTGSWQQFFLKEALTSWQHYCALMDQANAAGMDLSDSNKEVLANLEARLAESAKYYGLSGAEELLRYNMGAGADLDDYAHIQELLMRGNLYYDDVRENMSVTPEELDAFFTEHESQYTQSGITREGKFVDIRHILLVPEGGTTGENGAMTYSEEEWAACKTKAEDVLNGWTSGDQTEESFAELAKTMSQDPGSQTNGGLYENVTQGQMVPEFDAWCFDEKREPGHYGMVKTTYGYHLMYFVDSTPIWEYYTEQDLMAQKSNDMMEELVEQYPMEVDYSAISLGHVDMVA